MTEFFQFRYKNFRHPSGKRFYKIVGSEKKIINYVKSMETRKTHLRWVFNPPVEIKKQAEIIKL